MIQLHYIHSDKPKQPDCVNYFINRSRTFYHHSIPTIIYHSIQLYINNQPIQPRIHNYTLLQHRLYLDEQLLHWMKRTCKNSNDFNYHRSVIQMRHSIYSIASWGMTRFA